MESLNAEQQEMLYVFSEMLRGPIVDGGKKRDAGEKPSWKLDRSHKRAIYSHLGKWACGELIDKDSGSHPLVHLAVRALMQAWQEDQELEV